MPAFERIRTVCSIAALTQVTLRRWHSAVKVDRTGEGRRLAGRAGRQRGRTAARAGADLAPIHGAGPGHGRRVQPRQRSGRVFYATSWNNLLRLYAEDIWWRTHARTQEPRVRAVGGTGGCAGQLTVSPSIARYRRISFFRYAGDFWLHVTIS